MIVDIKNVVDADGWGDYVLKKADKKTPRREAIVISGDTEFGDNIVNGLNYKSGNSVNFVISFSDDDNVNKEKGRVIAKEFMNEFMNGFDNNEYHMDIVEHSDTDNLHYHVRIPKVNLLTNTQLKLYYHKTDLNYKKAVIDKVAANHELCTGADRKKTIPNEKVDQIKKWRNSREQKPFDFSKKKGRAEAEKNVTEYISNLISSGMVNNLDDVVKELNEMGLEIIKEGYDKGKDFHYLTVANSTGKIRLKGEIYGREFYGFDQKNRREKLEINRSYERERGEPKRSREDIERRLSFYGAKRLSFISNQYASARAKAYSRIKELEKKGDDGGSRNDEKPFNRNVGGRRSTIKSIDKIKIPYNYNSNYNNSNSFYRSIFWSVSLPKTFKSRGEKRSSERISETEILSQKDRKWTHIKEDKGGLNDRTRGEITDYCASSTRDIYGRNEENNKILQSHFELVSEKLKQSGRDNINAIPSVEKVREYINEYADKYQRRADAEVGTMEKGVCKSNENIGDEIKGVKERDRGIKRGFESLNERVKQSIIIIKEMIYNRKNSYQYENNNNIEMKR